MTSPTDMLAAIGAIANLPWKPLTAADYDSFADAGDGARICEVPLAAQGIICEALDIRCTFEAGMLAIIGGDALQVELHGVDPNGEPLAFAIPMTVIEH